MRKAFACHDVNMYSIYKSNLWNECSELITNTILFYQRNSNEVIYRIWPRVFMRCDYSSNVNFNDDSTRLLSTLRHGWMLTSHDLILDIISYPCPRRNTDLLPSVAISADGYCCRPFCPASVCLSVRRSVTNDVTALTLSAISLKWVDARYHGADCSLKWSCSAIFSAFRGTLKYSMIGLDQVWGTTLPL